MCCVVARESRPPQGVAPCPRADSFYVCVAMRACVRARGAPRRSVSVSDESASAAGAIAPAAVCGTSTSARARYQLCCAPSRSRLRSLLKQENFQRYNEEEQH